MNKKLYAAKKNYELSLTDWSKQLYALVEEKGGITYDFEDGRFPGEGFAVSTEGFERIVPLDTLWPSTIRRYIVDHEAQLFEEGYCLGIWIDGKKVYLDLSLVFEDQVEASLVARAHKQLAYYDLAGKETIWI